MLQVNFDPDLLLLLREIHYLASPPFNVRLPDQVRILLRSTDNGLLRSTAARLDTIVTRYNAVIASMKEYEKPLFEQKMAKIEEVIVPNNLCIHVVCRYLNWVNKLVVLTLWIL